MTAQKDIAEGKGATVPSHLAAEHAPGTSIHTTIQITG